MRNYEVVFIFHPSMTEEAVNQKLERFQSLITGDGAEITAVDHWGSRQLAYQVKGQSQGYYVVVQFTAGATSLTGLERVLKLDEELLRYLIVLSEGEPTSGMSVLAESPYTRGEGDDDDEDEEEEEEDEFGHGEASPPEFSGGRGRRRRMDGPRIELLNFKDVGTLSRFVTEQGKILPKRTTKVTSQFQRRLGQAVKRARYLALLPYVQNHDR
ncbi:MAG: 30S ribosomal protein S6 [Gemmatimonadota bacterium]